MRTHLLLPTSSALATCSMAVLSTSRLASLPAPPPATRMTTSRSQSRHLDSTRRLSAVAAAASLRTTGRSPGAGAGAPGRVEG